MMRNVFARFRLVALGLAILAAGSVVDASVLSLKAIKKNNVAVPVGQQSNLPVLGNDIIEAEIFLSGWANDFPKICLGGTMPGISCTIDANCPGGGTCSKDVRIFQLQINSAGLVSPDNGTALPLGWCAPLSKIECTNPAMCPAAYPLCSPGAGCTCAGHNPDLGAFITTSRPDFLLNGLDASFDIRNDVLNYLYYGLAIDNVGVPDTGVPRYLGTLILKIAANACGTFTINFVNEPLTTFIADPATTPNTSLPTLQPLLLTVSDCSRQLLSCSPSHCNIDARIAHDRLDINAKRNTNIIQMTFSKTTVGMAAADFEVTLVPNLPGDIVPAISSVTPLGDPLKTNVLFNRRIQQTRWTCIRDKGSNKRCCIGSLPADADDNRVSQSADTFEIYDNLQGNVNPVLPLGKCDTDRSLLCTGADLLMVGDLLNGADAFIEVNGDTLDLCPVMRLPP